MKVTFDWGVSSFYGWGVYGLNLALQWALDPSLEHSTSSPFFARDICVDALRLRILRGFLRRSGRRAPEDAVLLHGLGNDLNAEIEPARQPRRHRLGVAFFQSPLSKLAAERAKYYETIIAGSTWNERLLRGAGMENVRTILQGVDPSLFHPAPKRNLFPGKFLIFSGGKAEPRKAQDIVVKAFRIFAREHPEAMLVTAWHSPHKAGAGMDLNLGEFGGRIIDVGAVPNSGMPPILRDCDVAVFPNRAEGGTNLVAMEAIACGVPTILSANTGHLDLLNEGYGIALPQRLDEIGRGKTDVADLVEAMELVRRGAHPRETAQQPLYEKFTWAQTAVALKASLDASCGAAIA